jgi:extracellular factor (EF) 3-hydroxypalmitic acid methyl ester biosynthesis protein
LGSGEELREVAHGFVAEWETGYTLRPAYQVAVTNLSGFLAELSRWLDQVELAVGVEGPRRSSAAEREFIEDVGVPLQQKIGELFTVFEEEAKQIPPQETTSHRAFAQRQLHPYLLCSPFAYRSFAKPLGYAGDYEVVNMMVHQPLEGPNTYARILNTFNLATAPAAAHSNRIDMLADWLQREAQRAAREQKLLRILNVGCGPAVEVQRFIKNDPLSEQCQFHLLDWNQETCNYAEDRIREAMREGGRKVEVAFLDKSIHTLLREASRRRRTPEATYDFIYAAGLFDYLSDRICKRLLELFWEWTQPGGLILCTNVHPCNPFRFYMEHLLEWYLNYRDTEAMMALVPEGAVSRTLSDATGVNVFLEIRKAPGASE